MAEKPFNERKVKLTKDINGGLGTHKKGSVLTGLSQSAFLTITRCGMGEEVESTTKKVQEPMDPAPAPTGKQSKKK